MNNCEEYRQMIAADPSFDGGAAHLSQCTACQEFRAAMQSLDANIATALRIRVPELKLPELASIDTENVVGMKSRKSTSKYGWLALAASVMLAAFLSIRLIGGSISYDSLADEVLAHLDHEPAALQVTDETVPNARLSKVVPTSIARMDHSAGLITYAQTCIINGRQVPHLVIQGERGPVTILLMPEESIDEAETLDGDNIHGVILPVGGGSIAIIGDREEELERIEQSVLNSVTWST